MEVVTFNAFRSIVTLENRLKMMCVTSSCFPCQNQNPRTLHRCVHILEKEVEKVGSSGAFDTLMAVLEIAGKKATIKSSCKGQAEDGPAYLYLGALYKAKNVNWALLSSEGAN
eukprot:1162020-Pelagomonas_calceolata.AAC.8